MKKIIYYISFLLLLLIISNLGVSAKEITTCSRTLTDLKVRDEFIKEDNKEDILSTPCVDSSLKVYDFANLFTDSEESEIYDLVTSYRTKTNYDLVVVTTKENQKSVASYADDFYDYNDFGFNKTRDGLVFLIDIVNREVYISTTGYAIKMYSNNRIEAIIDSGYSSLENEHYSLAIKEMIKRSMSFYEEGYPKENENLLISADGEPYYLKKMPYFLIFLITSTITLVVALICYFKTRLKIKTPSVVSYLKDKELTLQKDNLINTIITHVPRSEINNSSGGGSSGGSTFHSSSSGSFHGGGGRHF